MKYKYLLLILFAVVTAFQSQAQKQVVVYDSAKTKTGMVLHADPRLAMIMPRHEVSVIPGRRAGSIHSGRGFRVQIYCGSDRTVATQRKIDFLRRFPGTRTYLTYIAPTFRVKVGDYRDRKAAQVMYQQVSRLYNPCMIVNDIIVINTFRDND